jgi:AcrR family transcriptional regulator
MGSVFLLYCVQTRGSEMAATRIDRRPERTRQTLLNAFVELILERGYQAVTVDDVVTQANIGRSTLYAHFGGLEGMLKQSLTRPSTQLAELVDQPATPEALAPLLRHFWDQRKRNKAFFVAPIRGLWVRRLAEMIEPRLAALAEIEARPAPPLPWSFIAVHVAEVQISLVVNWLALRPTTSPDTISAALIATTRATIDGLTSRELPIVEGRTKCDGLSSLKLAARVKGGNPPAGGPSPGSLSGSP